MLEPSAFSARWNAEVVASHTDIEDFRLAQAPASISTRSISASAADFLIHAGLPDGCAPFLSFRAVIAWLPEALSSLQSSRAPSSNSTNVLTPGVVPPTQTFGPGQLWRPAADKSRNRIVLFEQPGLEKCHCLALDENTRFQHQPTDF